MPTTLIKSRLHSDKNKPKSKREVKNTKSNLPPHLQSFKRKFLSGNGFVENKKDMDSYQNFTAYKRT